MAIRCFRRGFISLLYSTITNTAEDIQRRTLICSFDWEPQVRKFDQRAQERLPHNNVINLVAT